MFTHFVNPCRIVLFATNHPLRSDYSSRWVDRALQYVNTDNMGAFCIGVFVPHSYNDMRPWVTISHIAISDQFLVPR